MGRSSSNNSEALCCSEGGNFVWKDIEGCGSSKTFCKPTSLHSAMSSVPRVFATRASPSRYDSSASVPRASVFVLVSNCSKTGPNESTSIRRSLSSGTFNPLERILERVEQVAKRIGTDESESSEKIRGIVLGVTVRFMSIQAINVRVSD